MENAVVTLAIYATYILFNNGKYILNYVTTLTSYTKCITLFMFCLQLMLINKVPSCSCLFETVENEQLVEALKFYRKIILINDI